MAKERRAGGIRHLLQGGFVLLTNGYLKGFADGSIFTGGSKAVCLPGLNCYSCPGALGACPLGAMQAVLGSRNFHVSLYITGFLLAVGALLGRFVCGFLCPFGLVQDLIYRIPLGKKRGRIPGDRLLKFLPYAVLLIFVLLLPTLSLSLKGYGSPAFCKLLCPSGTLMAGWTLTLTNETLRSLAGALFTWKSAMLLLILAASIVFFRPFCRYLCPLGAIYGLLNPVSLYRFRVEEKSCTDCGACQRACKWHLDVRNHPNSRECIRCGDCVRACSKKALQ